MVNVDALKTLQSQAVSLAASLGLVYTQLSDTELQTFGTSYERSFVSENIQREIVDIHVRHQTESLVGAMVAKAQMNSSIDGEQPASNQIGGPLLIRAAHLGIGSATTASPPVVTAEDWDVSVGTAFAETNWIHSGGLLNGTAGDAIRVGQNMVFVIYGVASLVSSPVIESIRFTIDAKPKANIYVGDMFRSSNLKIKELDTGLLLKQNTTILGTYFPTATGTDAPQVLGVVFIPEPYLRTSNFAANINNSTVQQANNLIFPT